MSAERRAEGMTIAGTNQPRITRLSLSLVQGKSEERMLYLGCIQIALPTPGTIRDSCRSRAVLSTMP